LFHEALAVVQSVQKIGSGADIAASIFGGILAYRRGSHAKLYIKKLPKLIPLTVVYSGSKVATPIVVKAVQSLRAKHLKIFDHIYNAMDQCSLEAVAAIKKQDLQCLGELMNINQGLQDSIGVSNARLVELIFALRKRKEIQGAKISGAGLGDCVIGLGKISSKSDTQIEQIELDLTFNGLEFFTAKDL
jgi:mevalonate kinase